MNDKIGARAAVVLVSLLMFGSHYAHAQSSNQAAAETLFREARKLLDAGQFREACEKLEASRRLDPAAGTLLNLARCREKIGQTASAWVAYHEAIRAAKAAGQADREKSARERADALEPTLARLTVIVSPEARADKVQVRRDGVALPPELWGVNVPVDPGDHTVDAAAPGKKAWSIKTTLRDRAAANITVPALDPATSSPSVAPEMPAARKAPTSPVPTPTQVTTDEGPPGKVTNQVETPEGQSSTWTAGKTVAVVLAGVGVAGLTVGTLEWLKFERKKDDADHACPSAGCYDAQHAAATAYLGEANSARTIAFVSGAVGAASLVGATILWFTSGSKTTGTDALVITPVVGTREFGLGLTGAW